jgi:hypothetical protein
MTFSYSYDDNSVVEASDQQSVVAETDRQLISIILKLYVIYALPQSAVSKCVDQLVTNWCFIWTEYIEITIMDWSLETKYHNVGILVVLIIKGKLNKDVLILLVEK